MSKREIAIRITVFSSLYLLCGIVVASYFGMWLLIPLLVVIGVWAAYVYRMNVRVLGRPVVSMGVEGLEGSALTDIGEEGKVKVRGEIWNARSAHRVSIKKGEKVRVVAKEETVLEVERVRD